MQELFYRKITDKEIYGMNLSQLARIQTLKKHPAAFQKNHPKLGSFCNAVYKNAMTEGTVIEIKATSPDGRNYVTNLQLTREDLEFLQALQEFNQTRQ